uniref:Uncharacterized protein n=1 Tax=Panagrolaimus sp. JU765 TaxID=591449 RepID=A0AC34RJR8_9BILA
MASGARPSSNQRSSVSAGVGSADATSVTCRKSRNRHHGEEAHGFEGGASPPSTGLINCVVCGDRACSHYYYGVAACHGCKCFFWRSVKQQSQYFCRYDGNCDINVNARNACRYCRFQRCIKAGMQPEAVRITKDDKVSKSKKHGSEELLLSDAQPPLKKVCDSAKQLIEQFKEVENRAQEEADYNENDSATAQSTLEEIFAFPEIMDAFRTRVMYCVRLRNVTDEELNFCKFRTLTYAIDYIRAISSANLAQLSVNDQIVLLRHCYAPMTVFNTAVGTITATREHSLLCLPTGITVSKHEPIAMNSFMSHIVVVNILDSLLKPLEEMNFTETESVLMRAIIVLNGDARGLSNEARIVVSNLRDQLHNALYQYCQEIGNDAPLRFAKLLHLLPKITLLARDLIEHIKVSHTFNSEMRRVDPIFFELFGDIFQEERDHIAHVSPSSETANKDQSSVRTAANSESKHGDSSWLQPMKKKSWTTIEETVMDNGYSLPSIQLFEDDNGLANFGTNALLCHHFAPVQDHLTNQQSESAFLPSPDDWQWAYGSTLYRKKNSAGHQTNFKMIHRDDYNYLNERMKDCY